MQSVGRRWMRLFTPHRPDPAPPPSIDRDLLIREYCHRIGARYAMMRNRPTSPRCTPEDVWSDLGLDGEATEEQRELIVSAWQAGFDSVDVAQRAYQPRYSDAMSRERLYQMCSDEQWDEFQKTADISEIAPSGRGWRFRSSFSSAARLLVPSDRPVRRWQVQAVFCILPAHMGYYSSGTCYQAVDIYPTDNTIALLAALRGGDEHRILQTAVHENGRLPDDVKKILGRERGARWVDDLDARGSCTCELCRMQAERLRSRAERGRTLPPLPF
jgi:hypothetical protein